MPHSVSLENGCLQSSPIVFRFSSSPVRAISPTGSGTIDVQEFMVAVRTECGLGPVLVSDADLRCLFQEVDVDL